MFIRSPWTQTRVKKFGRPQLGDINLGESITMAPLVVKGKVLVGNSGGEFGVRGWLAALDADTGKIAWRAYATGPDQGCSDWTEFQAVLRAGPRQRSGNEDVAGASSGRLAEAPAGAGSPTTPVSTSSTTAPQIPGPGTPSSGRETTSGRAPSLPASPTPARRFGPIKSILTTTTITTA